MSSSATAILVTVITRSKVSQVARRQVPRERNLDTRHMEDPSIVRAF